MHILALGLNHRTAPVDLRERLAFAPSQVGEALRRLMQQAPATEAAILSTCNRSEVYAVTSNHNAAVERIKQFLAQFHNLPAERFSPHLYHCLDDESVKHLFRVACGVDSMVVGETQILAQVKEAFDSARACGTVRVVLDELFRRALRVGKRARTETDISKGALSVSSAAVELAKQIFGDLRGTNILLLGAGKMSELTARYLVAQGATAVFVTNRTYERAAELARKFNGATIAWDHLPQQLHRADIVISSTAAPHYVLRHDTVAAAMRARRRRPMFLIDIAVPRDIEPSVNALDNVFLFNIDDLEQVVAENRREREKEVHKVEVMIAEETGKFAQWLKTLEVTPTLKALTQKAEQIREAELQALFNRLPHLQGRDRELIQAALKAVVNKLLHDPLITLREAAQSDDGYLTIDVMRRAFKLDNDS
ncbi:MAG: glutamyl-tRNA reductase [Abditibacteriales bacterium]|nr:glutamyl-tRNA reductase [Abditibacteriales bacterium]MDW8366909.1 glutamyl-tRNA reductase [Abditibacteriales bacterium]